MPKWPISQKKLTNHLNTKQENVNSQITGPLQPKNFFTKKYEPLNEDSEVEEDVDEEEDSSSETPTIFSVSSKRRNITKLLSLLALHMEWFSDWTEWKKIESS